MHIDRIEMPENPVSQDVLISLMNQLMKYLRPQDLLRIMALNETEFLVELEAHEKPKQHKLFIENELSSSFEQLKVSGCSGHGSENIVGSDDEINNRIASNATKYLNIRKNGVQKEQVYYISSVEFQCRIMKSNFITQQFYIKNINEFSKIPDKPAKEKNQRKNEIKKKEGWYKFT